MFLVILSVTCSALSYVDLFNGLFGITGRQVANISMNATLPGTLPIAGLTAKTNPRVYWVMPGTFDQANCGNGQQDPGEECDDGNNNNNDGCDANCKLECGNGVINPGEQCGEPNLICPPKMDCNSYNCQCYPHVPEEKQRCCDGILTAPEECEHYAGGAAGPPMSVPPCAPFFTVHAGVYSKVQCINCICQKKLPPLPPPSANYPPHCGNGLMESGLGEQCDDGNQISGDGCSFPQCWVEWCGDNLVQMGAPVWNFRGYFPLMREQCDPPDGNVTCDDYCQIIGPSGGSGICGDGVVQMPNFVGFIEECDPPDGITCDDNCTNITANVTFCGDGIVQKPNSFGVNEQCEPPNTATCDANCMFQNITANATFCGDGIVQTPNSAGVNEQCEPPNTATCDANCQAIIFPGPPGIPPLPPGGAPGTGFCGDLLLQTPNSNGIFEQCEPPNTPICNGTCQLIFPTPPPIPPGPPAPGPIPGTCTDLTWNGDESDLDCGGNCPACSPPLSCWNNNDCTTNNCDLTNAQRPLPTNPATGNPYTLAEIRLLAGQTWIIPYQGVCTTGLLPGAPPPLPQPRININFNNGMDFRIGNTIFCNANIFDLEGDTILYVDAVIRDHIFYYNYGSGNLLNGSCVVHLPYNVTCAYVVPNILGLKGPWDCDYFYADQNSVNVSVSSSVDMLNTVPEIFPSTNTISVPVGTLITLTNVGVDPNLEDNLTFSTDATQGSIDVNSGTFTWQTASGDEGSYTWNFIVSDSTDTDSKSVLFQITGPGTGGTGTCGDGTVQTPNSAGNNEQCEPPGTATCDANCQIIQSGQQPPAGGGGSSGGGGGGHSNRRSQRYRNLYSQNVTVPTGPCEPQWQCKDWGVCREDGTQSRYCTNIAPCQRLQTNPALGRLKIETRDCEAMSCFDGILNQGEEGVDCGGPCPACPTCYDGIQNQGEEGIDCGGPCDLCALPEELFPAEVEREKLGWLSLLLLLIILAALVGVGIYTYMHHRKISFTKRPTILGKAPARPIKFKVAPKPAVPVMPIAGLSPSKMKKDINKLISQTYFELDHNNMRKVRQLTEKINQMYKQLPAAEKKEIYKNYMTLFKDIKKKL
ncbi:MAG: hypothetical protein KAT43_03690 [Nanoarchaeota archaeon]|nr:hypothetical protein [Nanoarchaeota archaeon]